MKLKDIIFEDRKFDINYNRFCLFDKNGEELNDYSLREYPNYLDLEVLETCESEYAAWGIGFKTIHIKLNIEDENLLRDGYKSIKFGDRDTRM